MNAFEEFMFDENYVLRFYRVDHGLVCTINESMVPELREVEGKLRQQQSEIAELKHMNRNWQISENILLLELEKLQHRELTDEEIEQVRVAIMGVAYWCADENMPEAYNAVKVCCGQVLGILVKAQEK